MDGLDDALRLIPFPFLYGLYKKILFFYVTSLHFLGKSMIEKAEITKSVRKTKIKTLQCCLKIDFSGVCYNR